jgi:hypothetical protein
MKSPTESDENNWNTCAVRLPQSMACVAVIIPLAAPCSEDSMTDRRGRTGSNPAVRGYERNEHRDAEQQYKKYINMGKRGDTKQKNMGEQEGNGGKNACSVNSQILCNFVSTFRLVSTIQRKSSASIFRVNIQFDYNFKQYIHIYCDMFVGFSLVT